MYRALCRASRVDCKEIDGPLTLCLPKLGFVYHFLRQFLAILDSFRLQTGGVTGSVLIGLTDFIILLTLGGRWMISKKDRYAYAIGRIEPDVIPVDVRQHSVIWSATVPLISFECVEWHASDRLRRQFGFTQGVSHQERDLGEEHGEVLIGPKIKIGPEPTLFTSFINFF
ncbi:hypothetical protein Ahy_B06g083705 [Arachis hypogaea]|uniref:Aminotransferase-like plant mobile domain-containing protein n=1 Tax=Arachis hypogaea TaxID=3818 RepID=A0A444YQH2_ARAHY|nr:hypothetical protein Ahy_B06g083705 [Arachis hypogaea]